jgi:glycerol-3-phosphate dehydrogenase
MTTQLPRVAVIGGGINGSGIAWELVRRGYRVVLFDKGRFGGATSSATTKMVHGGLRYLEHLDVGLVHEALRERAYLLAAVPDLVYPLEIVLPYFKGSRRPPWKLRSGLRLYDLLAGERNIAPHRKLTRDETLERIPLKPDRLLGGFLFYDAQVDDSALVRRVVDCAVLDGLDAREFTGVTELERSGAQWIAHTTAASERFDVVVNAVGPWMDVFLRSSAIESKFTLTLVRGSHVVLRRPARNGALMEVASDRRVVFALPWKGATLLGTTDVVHEHGPDHVTPSDDETDYLLAAFNDWFREPADRSEIIDRFAGVRPLLAEKGDPSAISREYRIERSEGVVNVFGGKLTTFMSLARKVGAAVDEVSGRETTAREPEWLA